MARFKVQAKIKSDEFVEPNIFCFQLPRPEEKKKAGKMISFVCYIGANYEVRNSWNNLPAIEICATLEKTDAVYMENRKRKRTEAFAVTADCSGGSQLCTVSPPSFQYRQITKPARQIRSSSFRSIPWTG